MLRVIRGAGVEFHVGTKAVSQLFEDMPKVLNQQMNRTFPVSATDFLKTFAKTRLVRGIFRVRRKAGKSGKRGSGQPSIPAKARAAGIGAKVTGRNLIDKKAFSVKTSNPLLVIREKGGKIEPVKGEWLYIRGKFKGRGATQRRKAYAERQRAAGSRYSRPIVARVRQIVQPAVLGFYSTWRAWRPSFRKLLVEGLKAAVKRMASGRSRRIAA